MIYSRPTLLEGDASWRMGLEANRRLSDVVFMKTAFPENSSDFLEEDIMVMRVFRSTKLGEELFLTYGSCYIFFALPSASIV